MTKHSHRYGVGSSIFFVLDFGRASSRDIVSAHTSFYFKFSLGQGGIRYQMKRIILQEGTEIEIKLIEELNSQNARVGDPVRLRVNENIYINNDLVIREGTKVKASVTVAEKRGMLGKAGKIDFSLNSVSSINNREIPLRAVKNTEGKNRQVGVIAGTLLLSPLFLLMKGKDASIEAGKIFTAFVDDDIQLELEEQN
jgi:hypothetical protein